ncbi:alpha/beta hydrolase [Streptomyces sp. NPDC086010]|uniref:alpha/beta hydrolase n=1 Tax=Streptomyces sp. NPDC086010 TaxID=3365745 RepID=UPI0037D4FF78
MSPRIPYLRRPALFTGAVAVSMLAVSATRPVPAEPRSLPPAGPAAAAAAVGTTAGTAAGRVLTARYNLGDLAFTPPARIGYTGRSELSGTVHYPAGPRHGRLPIVLLQHGSWATCGDASAERELKAATAALAQAEEGGDEEEAARQQAVIDRASALLWAWPCARGTESIPSADGYDYLGRALAAQGFVVVSMATNGINATAGGQADTVYRARAALIERHARLWQRLSRDGAGPLAAALVSATTGERVGPRFKGAVDLRRVGLLGHSMGGGGVMQEVADSVRPSWPAGIEFKAAFVLAPTATWDDTPVTRTPFAVMWGTCDAVNTGEYYEWNAPENRVPLFKYTLTGGNHSSYNRQWSPSSGQVASSDDAVPGTRPGTCRSQHPGTGPQTDQARLPEAQQRRVTKNRVTAFFARFLQGRRALQPYLSGEAPFPGERLLRPPPTPAVNSPGGPPHRGRGGAGAPLGPGPPPAAVQAVPGIGGWQVPPAR